MSSANDDKIALARESVKALNMQRQALEHESAAIVSELTAINPEDPTVAPMGIDTPLTDADGFPRNDIDVFRARMLRGRFAEIKTDHKKFMGEIEVLLKQLSVLQQPEKLEAEKKEITARLQEKPKPKFDPVTGKWVVRNWDGTIAGAGRESNARSFDNLSAGLPSAGVDNSMETDLITTTTPPIVDAVPPAPTVHRAAESNMPLARVESVAPTSPAATAGLQQNDIVLAFGSICDNLNEEITNLVRSAAANHEIIELRILRGHTDPILLQLKPRPWNGRGLLGCHIVPI